jgi:hypothetical protein
MKKILLSMAALLTFGLASQAADIVEYFENSTDHPWPFSEGATTTDDNGDPYEFPTSSSHANKATDLSFQSTETGLTYTFHAATAYYRSTYNSVSTILIGKSGSYIQVSALPINCKAVTVHTGASASKNVTAQVYVVTADGDVAVSTSTTKLASTDADFTFAIPEAYRAAGNIYKIAVTNSYNAQFSSIKFEEASTKPEIAIVEAGPIAFAAPANAAHEKTLNINSSNLTADVTYAISGTNADLFTVSESTNSTVTVAFKTATAIANAEATLTATSGDVSASVALTATAVSHQGTEEDPLTTADVITLNSVNNNTFYVTGKINAGCAQNYKDGALPTTTTLALTNIVLGDDEDANLIPVNLPANSEARTTLNISDNTDNVGQTVIVKGTLENYFGGPGVKNTEYVSGLKASGVETVTISEQNAPVEYFNLQGVRVNTPANGLYIRRQGNTVTKVVVK